MQLASQKNTQVTKWSSSWPPIFVRLLLCIPVLHAVLLVGLHDLQSTPAMLVHQLRPLGTLGSVFLLFYAASLTQGRHRWAWGFQALAMLFSTIFSFLRVSQNISVATSLLQALVVLIYLCSLIGTALYLQQRSWWLGSTWRVIVGGTIVGVAALVLMRVLLPIIFSSWPWNPTINTTLAYLAFDVGMLFAFILIALRYNRNSSPLLPIVILGLICLLMADSLYMLLSWMPGGQPFQVAILPLYTFHSILLAVGAYRDITHVAPESSTEPSTMPLIEWLLWVLVSLVVTVAAFTAASIRGTAAPALMIALALITIIHEVLAMFDYRRVTFALHQARIDAADRGAEHERTRIAAELHDSINYYLATIAQKLTRAQKHLTTNLTIANIEILETRGLTKFALADARASIHAMRSGSIQPLERTIKELGDSSINVRMIVTGTQRIGGGDVQRMVMQPIHIPADLGGIPLNRKRVIRIREDSRG